MGLSLVFYSKIHYTTYGMYYALIDIDIVSSLKQLFSVFSTLSRLELASCIIEILIIAFVVYTVLMWIRNTRAWVLLRGLVVIGIFILIAMLCRFNVILAILRSISYIAVFGLIIIFQDDIRSGLEHLGRQRVFSKILPNFNKLTKKISEDSIQEIVDASFAMAKVKTGALIVLEQDFTLEEYERTGIAINGEVTRQLLINIFEKNTPLHDGAVLIVGDTIKAATCYLPLSHNNNISKDLGTRHRAALGVSEVTDALTIVVSEETGNVSLCVRGRIMIMHDEKELLKTLFDLIYGQEDNNEKTN
ncbi:MAG: diadenylate cyclase CdaA [Lachnospiraceae bacterium]|nr:diadenylate cyclase CdaA [Lachnospiraceae bacterium]